jgi:hypothetical protein
MCLTARSGGTRPPPQQTTDNVDVTADAAEMKESAQR